MIDGWSAVVIAVVASDTAFERLDRSAVKKHATAQIRVDVPPQQHLLVEPVDRDEVFTEHELKVSRRVEADPFVTQRRLVEVQGWAETPDFGQCPLGVRPWESLPEPLGKLETRQPVVSIGELSAHLAEAGAVQRNDNHVGVRREQPPVRRIGTTRRGVASNGLDHAQMGAPAVALRVQRGGDADHSQQLEGSVGQGVG